MSWGCPTRIEELVRPMTDPHKYVYSFGGGKAEGKADMKDLLGGKGANLAEMSVIGLPVPPGFTITTEVCAATTSNGKKLPEAVMPAGRRRRSSRSRSRRRQEVRRPGRTRCSSRVRSGAALSMPGMMNTILNLGLNDAARRGPGQDDRQPPLRLRQLPPADQHVRLTVMGVEHEHFEHELARAQGREGGQARHRPRRPTTSRSWSSATRRSTRSTSATTSRRTRCEQL